MITNLALLKATSLSRVAFKSKSLVFKYSSIFLDYHHLTMDFALIAVKLHH